MFSRFSTVQVRNSAGRFEFIPPQSLDPRSEQASRQPDLNESGGLQTTARSGPQSPEALGEVRGQDPAGSLQDYLGTRGRPVQKCCPVGRIDTRITMT